MSKFTHIGEQGQVRMVDVSGKKTTLRVAVAQATISMGAETFENIRHHTIEKGNVIETARIAGIMAAKKTSSIIPMCHPLNITHAQIDFSPNPTTHSIRIEATVRILGQTGVEMEALTAVSISALAIYDMCKSHDKGMEISNIRLIEKSGGKSGNFKRPSKG